MLTPYVYEYKNHYQILVTDGTEVNSFAYEWGKDQDLIVSEGESIIIAESEIASRHEKPIML